MWWIIQLLGTGRVQFVESFSNRRAAPRIAFAPGQAKSFSCKEDAEGWAKNYLPGYNYTVVKYDSELNIILNKEEHSV